MMTEYTRSTTTEFTFNGEDFVPVKQIDVDEIKEVK